MAKTTPRTAAPAPLTVTIKGDRLIIDAPLEAPALSASGKSFVVASTRGNLTTDCIIDGAFPLIVGLNCYYKAR